jgi:hypothetical protein
MTPGGVAFNFSNSSNLLPGFPYNDKGQLVNWPTGMPIYECNSNCQCGPNCRNRVLQKGVTVVMEVYKTKSRGWGARTTEPVPRGKFICEYTGEVRIRLFSFLTGSA